MKYSKNIPNIIAGLLLVVIFLLPKTSAYGATIITGSFGYAYQNVPSGTVVSPGQAKIVGRVSHNNLGYIVTSMYHGNPDGSYINFSFALSSASLINGSITYEIRKNGINGELLYSKTDTYNNARVDGRVTVVHDTPSSFNPYLKSGETIDFIIINNLTNSGAYAASYLQTSFYQSSWAWDYQAVDEISVITQQAAVNAYNAANSANISAQGAKTSADTASARSQTAINQTIDAGTSAANWAHQAYDKSNIAAVDTNYIRNTELPAIETKINNLQVAVTNIQNSDILPPIVDVQTISGARATSGSSIQAVVTVTDNRPGPFVYSINGGAYINLPADGRIYLSISSQGNNSITLSVKDVAGNVGTKTIIIRKL